MHVIGARGIAGDPVERLAIVRGLGELQLLDARLVCGKDHLFTAAEHAERAMREGTNVAKSVAVEFVVYASGGRQIHDAIAKMGIHKETTEFAVVMFGGEVALEILDLTRDDAVLDVSPAKLQSFGITKEELGTVPPDHQAELVLERVALVDLFK